MILFISGNQKSAGSRRFLALAESLTSRVRVTSSATVLLVKQDITSSSGSSEDAKLLVRVAANLLAEPALRGLIPGQKVAFHNAAGGLAGVLGRRAAEQGLSATFTTSAEASGENDATSIPVFMPAREIRFLLPKDLARFVVASPEDLVAERLAAVLPVSCRVEHLTAFQGKDLYATSP